MADKGDIRHGMELGADDYLTKPFTRQELLNAITSRLLKQAKLMKQYNEEQQKTKALEQKVKELEALQIKDELSQELQQALLKISTAINLITKIQPGQKRDRNLKIIRRTCAAEIALIGRVPNLKSRICSQNQTLALILQD